VGLSLDGVSVATGTGEWSDMKEAWGTSCTYPARLQRSSRIHTLRV